jgi:aspartyl-tRNA(Asn)/glutamyl-tRNA(Gln) amidotransferase subunit A
LADISARDLDTAKGPPLNSFLTLNGSALAQAQDLDRRVGNGEPRGRLHCVPVAVKDNFDTADMAVSVGSLALVDNRPPRDADLVARIRAAGGIIVGKTNMDEFAMGIAGLSGAGGRVGNAYDTAMSPGGSSSGSGVAVASGFVPLALGSDNCGSLRIPAVYNGVVALRPTYGRFSTEGVFPIGFVNGTAGAIASDVTTLRTALSVLSDDWRRKRADIADGLSGRRIGILRSFNGKDPWAAADSVVRTRLAQAIAQMKGRGAEIVERVSINAFDTRLGIEFLKGFGARVDRKFASYPAPFKSWNEVCGSGLIRPEWTARQCRDAGASAQRREAVAVRRIADNRSRIVAMMDRLKLDAILYPTDGRGGARASQSDRITCFVAGSSGLPSGAVPMALDGRGMPIGIEWLGRPGSDEMLVGIMAAFETARGPLSPPKRNPTNKDTAILDTASLDIAQQNALRHAIGLAAFQSRKGAAPGDLEPDRFRALTERTIRNWNRKQP